MKLFFVDLMPPILKYFYCFVINTSKIRGKNKKGLTNTTQLYGELI